MTCTTETNGEEQTSTFGPQADTSRCKQPHASMGVRSHVEDLAREAAQGRDHKGVKQSEEAATAASSFSREVAR